MSNNQSQQPQTGEQGDPAPKPRSQPKPKATAPLPDDQNSTQAPPVGEGEDSTQVPPEGEGEGETFTLELDEFEEKVVNEVLAKLRQYRPIINILGLDDPDGIQAKLEEINLALGDPWSKAKEFLTPLYEEVNGGQFGQTTDASGGATLTITEVEEAIRSGNWSIFPLLEKAVVSGHTFAIAGTCCGYLENRPDTPGVPWNNRQVWRTRSGLVVH